MKSNWKLVLMVGLAALLVAIGGCGEDTGSSNNENQNAGENVDNNSTDDNLEDFEGADYYTEYDLRMTTFAFSSTSPARVLNSVIEEFIEDQGYRFPIVVLIEFRDIDPEAGTFRVRGGAGLKNVDEDENWDGNYVWDTDLEVPDFVEGEFDEEGNFSAALPLLNFVATIELETDISKTIIPIRDLELEGQLYADEDGSNPRVRRGELEGVVVDDEIMDVEVVLSPGQEGIPLRNVLIVRDQNFDYSGDGEFDSWLLDAVFDAEETVVVD